MRIFPRRTIVFALQGLTMAALLANAQQSQSQPQTPTTLETTAAISNPDRTTGIVHTAEGTPVPGAMVRVTNTDTNKVWVSWTDASGKFEFPSLPPGHYHVEASQLGFIPSAIDVELPVASASPIVLVLRVATLAELAAPSESAAPNETAAGNSKPGQGGAESAATNPGSAGRPNGRSPGRGAGGKGQ